MWIECFFPDGSGWQGFPEEVVVIFVHFLNFFLPPLAHPVTDVRFEAEAQRHHGVANAEKEHFSSQPVTKDASKTYQWAAKGRQRSK